MYAPPTVLDDDAFERAFAEAESALQGEDDDSDGREEPENAQEQADKLATTAGEVYDQLKFESETDEKFRNSNFMRLMQRLRDREIIVQGNDMVELIPKGTQVGEQTNTTV